MHPPSSWLSPSRSPPPGSRALSLPRSSDRSACPARSSAASCTAAAARRSPHRPRVPRVHSAFRVPCGAARTPPASRLAVAFTPYSLPRARHEPHRVTQHRNALEIVVDRPAQRGEDRDGTSDRIDRVDPAEFVVMCQEQAPVEARGRKFPAGTAGSARTESGCVAIVAAGRSGVSAWPGRTPGPRACRGRAGNAGATAVSGPR